MNLKEKWDDFTYNVSEIIYKISRPFYQLKQGIVNVIKWFPVIYKDRDWSYHYIFVILHKKLEHMEKMFRSDDVFTACANQTADEIKEAKDVLKRLIEDDYLSEALIPYHEKYGFNDKLYTFEKIEGTNSSKLVWTQNQEQMKMFREAGDLADKKKAEDLKYLFEYLHKNIEKWWD